MKKKIESVDPQERFKFGKNWSFFLKKLNEQRILEAEDSLKKNLSLKSLMGKTFLDVGSGSGLFSLAARRLGAKVKSFDYDRDSVACTRYLQEKYFPDDKSWNVSQGSVLDKKLIKGLEKFDIVYSWGVLHHTGHMYDAFENVAGLVKEGGHLFISIYNDQGSPSQRWAWVKKRYIRSGILIRFFLALYVLLRQWSKTFLKDFLKSGNPFKTWCNYHKNRGMSPYHDIIDWVGGYPFEVAKPEEVFSFFHKRGFELVHLMTCGGGLGCNEFVFKNK